MCTFSNVVVLSGKECSLTGKFHLPVGCQHQKHYIDQGKENCGGGKESQPLCPSG